MLLIYGMVLNHTEPVFSFSMQVLVRELKDLLMTKCVTI